MTSRTVFISLMSLSMYAIQIRLPCHHIHILWTSFSEGINPWKDVLMTYYIHSSHVDESLSAKWAVYWLVGSLRHCRDPTYMPMAILQCCPTLEWHGKWECDRSAVSWAFTPWHMTRSLSLNALETCLLIVFQYGLLTPSCVHCNSELHNCMSVPYSSMACMELMLIAAMSLRPQ